MRAVEYLKKLMQPTVLKNSGYCNTCKQKTTFISNNEWLRDHYRCSKCHSIPRERAIMQVIETHFPAWQNLTIHESSPGNRGASKRLSGECKNYISSHFFEDQQPGSTVGEFRCEDLEALTFADESIDLHITQDVLEHVFHPSRVFGEIGRTLRPGGAHIFTVPIVNKAMPSRLRASVTEDGQVRHIESPSFHGNPISEQGSLVTVDWGYDICEYIYQSCGLFTHTIHIDDLSKGIRAELIEVFVTTKPDRADGYDAIP